MKFIVAALLWIGMFSQFAFADLPPSKILSVGAIAINPYRDAKVLADWYSRFGIKTKEIQGGYYGEIDTVSGPLVFGIHPKKKRECPANISVVFRVENFRASLLSLKEKGILPESIENDQQGQFAHFRDPDGNKVSIWGEYESH